MTATQTKFADFQKNGIDKAFIEKLIALGFTPDEMANVADNVLLNFVTAAKKPKPQQQAAAMQSQSVTAPAPTFTFTTPAVKTFAEVGTVSVADNEIQNLVSTKAGILDPHKTWPKDSSHPVYIFYSVKNAEGKYLVFKNGKWELGTCSFRPEDLWYENYMIAKFQ